MTFSTFVLQILALYLEKILIEKYNAHHYIILGQLDVFSSSVLFKP